MGKHSIRVSAVAGLIAVLVGFSGISANAASLTPSATGTPRATFTVLGDSNTTGRSANLGAGVDAGVSWTVHARSTGGSVVGGFAGNGWTMPMLAGVAKPVKADVLVIMAGTNDLRLGVTFAQSRRAMDLAVAKAGVRTVLLLAIAPRQNAGRATNDWNRQLSKVAASRGWAFHDPWKQFRASDGRWKDLSATSDGVHGTKATYRALGKDIGLKLAEIRTAF